MLRFYFPCNKIIPVLTLKTLKYDIEPESVCEREEGDGRIVSLFPDIYLFTSS